MRIHREPNQVQTDFLLFRTTRDISWSSQSATDLPKLSYLRVELIRLRPGMEDFILRFATPLDKNNVRSNTIVTIRSNKNQGNQKGAEKIAALVATEMKNREDNTHAWETLNVSHLAKMIVAPLQYFSRYSATEQLQFTTEALL